jgi:Trypsin-co-occurring domain 1
MPIIENTTIASNGETVTIYIEVDEAQINDPHNPYEDLRGTGQHIVTTAKDVFGSSMELIRTCAEQVFHAVEKVGSAARPTGFEVQLAIKLDATVGAILAKTGAEAQLQVTLKWEEKEQK